MRPAILTPDALHRALTLRDLADPAAGPHAMSALAITKLFSRNVLNC